MMAVKRDPRQKAKNHFKTIWKKNIIIGIIFILIGVVGFLYGWEKESVLGGLTWVTTFMLISLYSFLVLAREEY